MMKNGLNNKYLKKHSIELLQCLTNDGGEMTKVTREALLRQCARANWPPADYEGLVGSILGPVTLASN